LSQRLHHVRQGHGRSGPNRDYVLEAVEALEALGYRETDLHLLAEGLRGTGLRQQEPGHQAAKS
jgi:cation transport protein ChaC